MADINAPLLADLLRQSLQQGQTPRLEVTSNSMAPLLRQGDLVLLEAVTPEQLTRGDVITLFSASQIMTHRYWGRDAETRTGRLLTRGDRPLAFDTPWPPEALIGRMIGRSRQERVLCLTTAAGHRLNDHLCWLAGIEFKWWGNRVNGASPTRHQGFRRALRGAIYAWATFITGILGLMA